MSWPGEAFREDDETLEWEVELRPAAREDLERALSVPDLSVPASYLLSVGQVVVAWGLADTTIDPKPDLDPRRLAFYLSEVADEGPAAASREAARDLDRPDSDRTVWGHTNTFGLFACDALAGGLGIVGAELSARAVVDAVDEEFRSFTEPDGRKLLAHIDDAVEPGAGCWWTRVPVGGPARREMDTIVRNLS